MHEDVKEWWEATAVYFQDEYDHPIAIDYGVGAGRESDLDLLGDLDGADVVELGCGGAQCGIAMAKHGANVVGVDLSSEQLSHARKLCAEHEVDLELVQGDVTDVSMLAADGFDVVFSANAYQWVSDLDAAFGEARRLLRDDGIFVLSLPHPVYQQVDPETHEVAGSYFATGRRAEDVQEMDIDMVTYHHTVADIHGALRDAGFHVDQLLEPGSSDPDDYDRDLWEFDPELMAKLPPTLVVRATPVS